MDELPTDAVRNYMTREVVTAAPLTPISELARLMVGGHIHRVVIVDAERRPVGLVSGTDILAAVAQTGPRFRAGAVLEAAWPVAR